MTECLEAQSMKRTCVFRLHIFREVLKGNWSLGRVFFDWLLLQKLKCMKSVNSNFYISEHM